MPEGLDQNKNTESEKAKILSDYEKFFNEYLDYFSSYIITLPDRMESIRTVPIMNEVLLKQKEFIDFCKKDHPKEYEALKTAMLNNKAIIKKGRFERIDDNFFNFE